MTTSNSKNKAKQVQTEKKLKQLTIAYKKLVKQVHEKTSKLTQSNRLLQTEITERKRIEAEIVEITLAEQKRFGSQLHDGLCQELTAILVFAKALTQKLQNDKTLELVELNKISDMLLNAVDQARDTARGLYPGELEGTSLMHSLEELCSMTTGAKCSFHCLKPILIEDKNIATHLYRIVQEAISNAVKHGKAKNIQLNLSKKEDVITLSISDDGTGLAKGVKSYKGIGLKIMKYRAHMMNASFEMKTNSPSGLLLECKLNIPKTQRSKL